MPTLAVMASFSPICLSVPDIPRCLAGRGMETAPVQNPLPMRHFNKTEEMNVEKSLETFGNRNNASIHAKTGSLWPEYLSMTGDEIRKDHFVEQNGIVFAGKHLILDLWGGRDLDSLELMEKTLRSCVKAAQATLLHIHLHHFSPNGGISGVAVLAESHISVHTWPEREFAAFDIFMCGVAHPAEAIPVINEAFKPASMEIHEILRGK
jgi:S-adenosylmethionine decarboxylase